MEKKKKTSFGTVGGAVTNAAAKLVEENTGGDFTNAAAKLVEENTGGDFTYSRQKELDDVFDKIYKAKDFSYNAIDDPMYQQYLESKMQTGKRAMEDTMGKAASMTGGYGNTYAATVGNQAYMSELEGANDIIPELMELAYNKHQNKKQDLLNMYSILSGDRDSEYSKYRDTVSDARWEKEYSNADEENVPEYTYEETANVNSFVARIRTPHEFARGGDDKAKYGTYKNYVKGMLEKYGEELTDNEIATIAAMYGL